MMFIRFNYIDLTNWKLSKIKSDDERWLVLILPIGVLYVRFK